MGILTWRESDGDGGNARKGKRIGEHRIRGGFCSLLFRSTDPGYTAFII